MRDSELQPLWLDYGESKMQKFYAFLFVILLLVVTGSVAALPPCSPEAIPEPGVNCLCTFPPDQKVKECKGVERACRSQNQEPPLPGVNCTCKSPVDDNIPECQVSPS